MRPITIRGKVEGVDFTKSRTRGPSFLLNIPTGRRGWLVVVEGDCVLKVQQPKSTCHANSRRGGLHGVTMGNSYTLGA